MTEETQISRAAWKRLSGLLNCLQVVWEALGLQLLWALTYAEVGFCVSPGKVSYTICSSTGPFLRSSKVPSVYSLTAVPKEMTCPVWLDMDTVLHSLWRQWESDIFYRDLCTAKGSKPLSIAWFCYIMEVSSWLDAEGGLEFGRVGDCLRGEKNKGKTGRQEVEGQSRGSQ